MGRAEVSSLLPSRAVFVAVGAGLVAAGVFGALSRQEEWVGWLAGTMLAVESGAVWLGALSAAVAAWAFGLPRAEGMEEWLTSSPRTAAQQRAPMMARLVVTTASAALVIALLLIGISLQHGLVHGTAHWVVLLSLPTLVAYAMTWAGVGAWLGTRLRREIAIPTAAVVVYASFAVCLYWPDSSAAAFAVGDSLSFDFVAPSPGWWWARAAFWTASAVAVCGALARPSRVQRSAKWLASASAGALIVSGPTLVPVAEAASTTCFGAAPAVCAPGSFATALPRYRAAAQHSLDALPPALHPDALVTDESELRDLPSPDHKALAVPPVAGYANPARLVDQSMFDAHLGDALFLSACRDTGPTWVSAVALDLWWYDERGVPSDGTAYPGALPMSETLTDFDQILALSSRVRGLDATQRDRWLTDHADDVWACRVTPDVFP